VLVLQAADEGEGAPGRFPRLLPAAESLGRLGVADPGGRRHGVVGGGPGLAEGRQGPGGSGEGRERELRAFAAGQPEAGRRQVQVGEGDPAGELGQARPLHPLADPERLLIGLERLGHPGRAAEALQGIAPVEPDPGEVVLVAGDPCREERGAERRRPVEGRQDLRQVRRVVQVEEGDRAVGPRGGQVVPQERVLLAAEGGEERDRLVVRLHGVVHLALGAPGVAALDGEERNAAGFEEVLRAWGHREKVEWRGEHLNDEK
jgi:hypothetical protein